VSVSSARGAIAALGVNVSVVPFFRQVPATAGTRLPTGEFFASGAENVTLMAAVGSTLAVPADGLTIATASGVDVEFCPVREVGADVPPPIAVDDVGGAADGDERVVREMRTPAPAPTTSATRMAT